MIKYGDMKNKLKMVNHSKNSENSLLRAVAERMIEVGSRGWISKWRSIYIQLEQAMQN